LFICRVWIEEDFMKLINPAANPVVPTPDHTNVTSQEIAGEIIGAKTCVVKLGAYQSGGTSIFHVHPHQEEVFYILEGALTLVDKNKNELTAHPGEALYVPAGEEHAAFNHGPEKAVYLAVKAPAT
jgi:mannose-6-phosphate isomerase-like protein (cupin superfamily)